MKKAAIIFLLCIFCESFSQLYDTAMNKYTIVKTWQGPINIRINKTSESTDINNSSMGNVILSNDAGGMTVIWPLPQIINPTACNYSIYEHHKEPCNIEKTSGGQMPWNVLLGIDIYNKTYYLHLNWNEQVNANISGTCDGESVSDNEFMGFFPGEIEIKDYPMDLNSVVPILKGNTSYVSYDEYTVTADWDLKPLSGSQVTIDPVEADWLPENNSVVTTKLHWGAENTATNLKFTLYDISSEPGTCLNDINGDKTLDLTFDSAWITENHYQITKQTEDEMVVERASLELTNELIIAIKCFDYGAYGKLKAEIRIDGEWKQAVVTGGFENFVSIPFDKNGNHIADKWEKDVGIFDMNLSEHWDDDPEPVGQRSNGDGYVLYEEYRGFNAFDHLLKKPENVKIDGMHFRTDPKYKDVFVFAEGFSFKSMYHSNPANLNWHLISRNDMIYNSVDAETHRWVNNKTSEKYYYAKQYAINVRVITEIPNWQDSEDAWGLTYRINGIFDELDSKLEEVCRDDSSPLKCKPVCFIFVDNIYNTLLNSSRIPTNIDQIIFKSVERTLIHEIGHNLGIPHHGGGTAKDQLTYEYPECSMRYIKKGEFYDYEQFELHLDMENSYCKSSRFNCYGYIDVKSDR